MAFSMIIGINGYNIVSRSKVNYHIPVIPQIHNVRNVFYITLSSAQFAMGDLVRESFP